MDGTTDPGLPLAPDGLTFAPADHDIDQHQRTEAEVGAGLAAMQHQIALARARFGVRPVPKGPDGDLGTERGPAGRSWCPATDGGAAGRGDQSINRRRAHRHQSCPLRGRHVHLPVPFERVEERRQQRRQPLTATLVAHRPHLPHQRLIGGVIRRRPPTPSPTRRVPTWRRRLQQPDRRLAVIPRRRAERVQHGAAHHLAPLLIPHAHPGRELAGLLPRELRVGHCLPPSVTRLVRQP